MFECEAPDELVGLQLENADFSQRATQESEGTRKDPIWASPPASPFDFNFPHFYVP